jgi:hypothetical protein
MDPCEDSRPIINLDSATYAQVNRIAARIITFRYPAPEALAETRINLARLRKMSDFMIRFSVFRLRQEHCLLQDSTRLP